MSEYNSDFFSPYKSFSYKSSGSRGRLLHKRQRTEKRASGKKETESKEEPLNEKKKSCTVGKHCFSLYKSTVHNQHELGCYCMLLLCGKSGRESLK